MSEEKQAPRLKTKCSVDQQKQAYLQNTAEAEQCAMTCHYIQLMLVLIRSVTRLPFFPCTTKTKQVIQPPIPVAVRSKALTGSLDSWDRGFECRRGNRCTSLVFTYVV